MDKDKITQFIENIVNNYKHRRNVFLKNHWYKIFWYFKRIRPSTKYREKEFKRMIDEEIKFLLDEGEEIKGKSDLANIDDNKIIKSKYILKSHVLRLKYRADYLALFLGLLGLFLTIILVLWKLNSAFSLWPLVPLVVTSMLVIIERSIFVDKICLYEEILNLIEYKLES